MIIAPHRAFAVRHSLTRRNVVPAVGPMINRMEQQALMVSIRGKIRLIEQRACYGEAGLNVAGCVLRVAGGAQVVAQTEKPLRGDGGGRTVHRLPTIERIGGFVEISAEPMQVRRAGVPHRNTISAGVFEIVVGSSRSGTEQRLVKPVGRESPRTPTF